MRGIVALEFKVPEGHDWHALIGLGPKLLAIFSVSYMSGPTAHYGIILLLAAFSYWLLQRMIMNQHSGDSPFVGAIGKDWKGKLSPLLYLIAALTAYVSVWISGFFSYLLP